MTEGKVTGGWAYRHHRLWLRKEAREGVIDERQTPPPGHALGRPAGRPAE
jgi:formate dehydrogenase subunit gamma